jgi:hypothetical protein
MMIYNADCYCPKCSKERVERAIRESERRRQAGISNAEAEKAIERAVRDYERNHWPCGEPR